MRALALSLLAFLAAPQIAPVSQDVATTEESHHKFVLENTYIRLFHVRVPVHEATLLHRHNLAYVTVSLGNNDFINSVVGKEEREVVQRDQQIGYSEGGFAHTIKPVNDSSFNNITVELLRPQGVPKNRCEQIVDGPLDCKSGPDSPLKALLKLVDLKPAFTTDEIVVGTISLASGVNYSATAADAPQLVIACDHSEFKIELLDRSADVLHGGEILWLPTGASAKITSTVAQGSVAFVLVTFNAADKNVK